jgi:hypothetical protein
MTATIDVWENMEEEVVDTWLQPQDERDERTGRAIDGGVRTLEKALGNLAVLFNE